MTDFIWTQNSHAMFEASLKAAPPGFRRASESGLRKGLVKAVGEGGEVSEADLVHVIKANTPAPFIPQGLKAVKPLLSDPSLLDD